MSLLRSTWVSHRMFLLHLLSSAMLGLPAAAWSWSAGFPVSSVLAILILAGLLGTLASVIGALLGGIWSEQ